MKTKTVTRYECEHCGKRGYSAGHMRRHESACTKNPNRVCRVCKMDRAEFERDEAVQPDLKILIAVLPDPEEFRFKVPESEVVSLDKKLSTAANEALPKLRELSGNCPACIMAALRQAHIPVGCVSSFSFTDEMKSIWADINQAQSEREYALW